MRFTTFAIAFAPLILSTFSMPMPVTDTTDITPVKTADFLAKLSAAYEISSNGATPASATSGKILVNTRFEIDENYMEEHQAPSSLKTTLSGTKVRRQSHEDAQYKHLWQACRVQCETSSGSPSSSDVMVR